VVCLLTGNGLKDTLTGPQEPGTRLAEYAEAAGAGPPLAEEVQRWTGG
jgi:hypothetical protein